ncbi:MAG: GNAT family N-acetyltransferase [Alphaproteobacteria bacterium]|nr:GNAT family N-acetyltransferase [Alphaproteobacteria bacterium]
MSAPPTTLLFASPAEEAAIREAVRHADPLTLGAGRVLARPAHGAALLGFLSDPAVSGPIYDLPRPFTLDRVAAWIAEGETLHERGEGLLILTRNEAGEILSYAKITVWPERASGELGGALRASYQSSGAGGDGAPRTIQWMFERLSLRVICLTAALDNIRSARLIDRIGFTRMGERDSVRGDGSVRRSLYWEMTREAWAAARNR